MRPRMLDLFCGAGGCARGYVPAGFDVVGVDIAPQPRYLLSGAGEFVQADALEYIADHAHEYDVIHASPPCQAYCGLATKGKHPDLLLATRGELMHTGRPYIIENIETAPLAHPVRLCGSMFGLHVRRHRLFESSDAFFVPQSCRHTQQGTIRAYYGKRAGLRAAGYAAP